MKKPKTRDQRSNTDLSSADLSAVVGGTDLRDNLSNVDKVRSFSTSTWTPPLTQAELKELLE